MWSIHTFFINILNVNMCLIFWALQTQTLRLHLLYNLWSTQIPDRPRLWCRGPGFALQPSFPWRHWWSCCCVQLEDWWLLGRREKGNTQPPTQGLRFQSEEMWLQQVKIKLWEKWCLSLGYMLKDFQGSGWTNHKKYISSLTPRRYFEFCLETFWWICLWCLLLK